MKYQIKVGVDFDPEAKMQVTVEVNTTSNEEDKKKASPLADWKVLTVLAVFILVFSSGAYAAATGNASLFEKLLDSIVKVAPEHPKGKIDGKETKDNSGPD